jgi:hypothetical protein
MKSSRAITLTLVPIVAAAYAGCGQAAPTHQQVCVDEATLVIDDRECWQPNRAGVVAGPGYFPHWYYVPYRSGGYPIGMPLSGGSLSAPSSGARIVSGHAAPVETGGFGGTWHGVAG